VTDDDDLHDAPVPAELSGQPAPSAPPPRPGPFLRDYLRERGISQSQLADAMGISRVRVHHFLTNRSPVSAEMALRLAKALGTSERYWIDMDIEWRLFEARRTLGTKIDQLQTLI
jgi:antitoxin HigA-1